MESTSIQDKTPLVVGLAAAMLAVTVIGTALRLWARVVIPESRAGWDDFFFFGGAIFSAAECSLAFYEAHLGYGKHAWTLSVEDVVQHAKVQWINIILWSFAVGLPKFSVAVYYRRVFGTMNKKFNNALWIIILFHAGWLIACVLVSIFRCTPVSKAWLGPLKPGTCTDFYAEYVSSTALSLFVDMYLLVLPLPMLYALNMKASKRIFVAAMFLCGYGVIAVTIGRLVAVTTTESDFELDSTYAPVTFGMWALAEGPIFVLCLALPHAHHLAKKVKADGTGALLGSGHSSLQHFPEKVQQSTESFAFTIGASWSNLIDKLSVSRTQSKDEHCRRASSDGSLALHLSNMVGMRCEEDIETGAFRNARR